MEICSITNVIRIAQITAAVVLKYWGTGSYLCVLQIRLLKNAEIMAPVSGFNSLASRDLMNIVLTKVLE